MNWHDQWSDDNYTARRIYDPDRRRWVILPPPITGQSVWYGSEGAGSTRRQGIKR